MRYDTILKNGSMIDPCNDRYGKFDVALGDGKVLAVEADIDDRFSKQCLDCTGKMILPGIIDPHVHVSEWIGGGEGHKMMASRGVITAIDATGPAGEIIDNLLQKGSGLNIGWLNLIGFSLANKIPNPTPTEITSALSSMMEEGALGVKIMGGHYPLEPEATAEIIAQAAKLQIFCTFHVGTTNTGSDLKGLIEAVELARTAPLHIPHINAYCRGCYDSPIAETQEALKILDKERNIFSDSYLFRATGTSGFCRGGVPESNVTKISLERGGYPATEDGLSKAINEGYTSVSIYCGGENQLITGEKALSFWREKNTIATVSFPINSMESIYLLATAKNPNGKFIVNSFSTDGGGIPRNTIVSYGLALVRMGAITLNDFAIKSSVAPAAMLGLAQKGHLGVEADADVTVLDLETGKAVLGIALGRIIMVNGTVVGSGGTVLTTETNKNRLKNQGVNWQIVDVSQSLGRG